MPALPALQTPAQNTSYLVYLDAWETEVDRQTDGRLVDARIGVETCVRLERVWVVRVVALTANADPLNPKAIPAPTPPANAASMGVRLASGREAAAPEAAAVPVMRTREWCELRPRW